MNLKNSLISFLEEFRIACEKAGRKAGEIKVLYAVKYLNPQGFVDFIRITKELGIGPVTVGENRVQIAQEKMNHIKKNCPDLLMDFHLMMIGPLQSNKINKAVGIFEEIHSIDSLEIAGNLDKRLERILPVYLEVNVSGEQTKHGFRKEEMDKVLKSLKSLKSLGIKGLMTMAPNTEDEGKIREVFRKLRELADHYNLKTSMGMSHDWKIAVEEGSDMVRVGGRIFSC